MGIWSGKVFCTLLPNGLTSGRRGVALYSHVEVDGSGQESDQYARCQETAVKEPSQLTTVPPEQAEVEERWENKGENARGKTADQCQTEFKARDADGHAPRHEDEEGAYRADHKVANHFVTNALHVCVCLRVCI